MVRKVTTLIAGLLSLLSTTVGAEESRRYSVATTWHSFANVEAEATNIQMYELHLGYRPTPEDKIGIKMATWKLFEPLGIQLWDPHLMNESAFYPGRLAEQGLGITYERTVWKDLFVSLEVLPLAQQYLDEKGKPVADGFRLYTSYHVGYRFTFLDGLLFVAPQVHCNYWPYMTEGPKAFRAMEEKSWSTNYFLFEPNLYVGMQFP